jgi:ribosomal protein L37E
MATCSECGEDLSPDWFRKTEKVCSWCAYSSTKRRAEARWKDIQKRELRKGPLSRLRITKEEFVAWYEQQPDLCSYCGLSRDEAKLLRLRTGHGGGYYVSWDIDRIDPARGYESGNLALSCFACNTAKGRYLSGEEARIIGQAMRQVWNLRLSEQKKRARPTLPRWGSRGRIPSSAPEKAS